MSKHLGLIAALMLAAAPAAAAPGAPEFDARPGCQAGADSGLSTRPNVDQCVASELRARDDIARQWSEFNAADKTRCVEKTKLGGPPSYIEVLTCLEIARDARRIPRQGTTGLETDRNPAR